MLNSLNFSAPNLLCSKLEINYIKEITTYSRIMKLCNEQQLQSKIEENKTRN